MKITELEEDRVASVRYNLLNKIDSIVDNVGPISTASSASANVERSEVIKNLAETYNYLLGFDEARYEDFVGGDYHEE